MRRADKTSPKVKAKFEADLKKGFADKAKIFAPALEWLPDQHFTVSFHGAMFVIRGMVPIESRLWFEPEPIALQARQWMDRLYSCLETDPFFANYILMLYFFDRHKANTGGSYCFYTYKRGQSALSRMRATIQRFDRSKYAELDLFHVGPLLLYPLKAGQYFIHFYDETAPLQYKLGGTDKLALVTVVDNKKITDTPQQRQEIVSKFGHYLINSPYRTLTFKYVERVGGLWSASFSYPLPGY